ncbi:MAG: glycosyltransferase family 2 protein [Actinomycetota bacterium]|nr:glycosyltransferase family 2 protein [Actinomycetota bacterium]
MRACLLSLPAACEGIGWRATVIDNVSGDGSREMLAETFPDVRVIANRRRLGFGANHNQVLKPLIAGGADAPRYVLILNDDTTLKPGAVTTMAMRMDADPNVGAVVPRIVSTDGRVASSRIAYPTARWAWRSDWTDRTEPDDPDDGFLQGCCLMVRVAAIAQVGPFDERFFLFYEDTDLSRRLADGGWRLGVCPEAVVVHVGHVSVFKPGMLELTPKQGRRSRYLYFAKHHGRARAELITLGGRLLLLVRGLKATAGAALTHDAGRRDRGRRLLGLARFNPRRPLPQERRAQAEGPAPELGARAQKRK